MDQKLLGMVESDKKGDVIRAIDGRDEVIELEVSGQTRRYPVKSLGELYGKGTGRPSIDMVDDEFMAILLPIEEAIVDHYEQTPSLTDGQVSLALEALGMDPEAPAAAAATDALWHAIQFRIRVALSLNDYSRQDVKLAIRKIAKSVQRHTRAGGPRGYLDFIRDQLHGI